jgi:hypothetical protein
MAWISFKTSLEEHKKQGVRSLVAQMITLLPVDARALATPSPCVRIASR